MKAKPVKNIPGEGYVACSIEEATYVTVNIPGPSGNSTFPVITHGKREGTGCWTWNGDTEKPTLKPSVLSQSGHFMEGHTGTCWCDYNREHPDEPKKFVCFRCHTWINDGKAQFLEDSSHEFVGQTLDLLDVE